MLVLDPADDLRDVPVVVTGTRVLVEEPRDGIGICRGGSVTAEETPGGGLTMVIDLPAVVAELTPAPSATELERVES